jgi:hypothetical protein
MALYRIGSNQKAEYQAARNVAAKELEELLSSQKKTEQRIAQLRQTIASLDALAGRKIVAGESLGLTDAIRSIFKALPEGSTLPAIGVKSRLIEMGFVESQYSNFMSSIHVVLNRLEESKEIRRRLDGNGLSFEAVPKDYLKDL